MTRVAISCGFLAACTSVGPMPATTGISAVPHGRPGAEVALSTVPVFKLSNAASGKDRNGQAEPQLAAVLELLKQVPGLIVGGRIWGNEDDLGAEPQIGYRRAYGDVAFAAVAFGTKMGATDLEGVRYDAIRAGVEVLADGTVARFGSWGQLHAGGGITATVLSADGTYCVEDDGNARDCDDSGGTPMVEGEVSGLYTSASLLLALDIARRPEGVLHVVRIGATFAAGHMPRLIGGRQQYGDVYVSGGLGLMVGFGAAR